MSLDSFPNAKSKLLGAGEDSEGIIVTPATAGLTGDLVMAKVLDSGEQTAGGTTSSSMVNSRGTISGGIGNQPIIFSNVTTPTEVSTLVIVVVASNIITVSGNTVKDWLLKRGTTTIDTFSLTGGDNNSNNIDIRLFTDTTPEVGTHTYALEEDDANTYGVVGAQLFFIEGTDTHAGFIDTVAIAGKQINVPDSHTTHEIGEIPA